MKIGHAPSGDIAAGAVSGKLDIVIVPSGNAIWQIFCRNDPDVIREAKRIFGVNVLNVRSETAVLDVEGYSSIDELLLMLEVKREDLYIC